MVDVDVGVGVGVGVDVGVVGVSLFAPRGAASVPAAAVRYIFVSSHLACLLTLSFPLHFSCRHMAPPPPPRFSVACVCSRPRLPSRSFRIPPLVQNSRSPHPVGAAASHLTRPTDQSVCRLPCFLASARYPLPSTPPTNTYIHTGLAGTPAGQIIETLPYTYLNLLGFLL